MSGRGGRVLAGGVVAVLLILSACGGSDDDSTVPEGPTSATEVDAGGSGTTTAGAEGEASPGDEEYCRVVRRTQGLASDEAASVIEQLLAAAPAELKGALETLQDNVEIAENYDSATSEERARIKQPLVDVLLYDAQQCGVSPFA